MIYDEYLFRRAESSNNAVQLHELFSEVFYPQDVGTLAETIFHSLPGMKNGYWFIAEERKTSTIVSAFALIPWILEMEGIRLKVAEMGIVGTQENHRNKGLMNILNQEFDRTLKKEKFDFAFIQGIPGFYHHFGFYYAIPLDNHINLPLHPIPGEYNDDKYRIRLAGADDIPYLMREDEIYRKSYFISTFRSEENWRYLFNEGLGTEYGSEYWIIANNETNEKYYCRIPHEGFGKGLIVSEISEGINNDALQRFFTFFKQKAIERNKPYIRLNLHGDSTAGRVAAAMGAEKGRPYAWQIKIPDKMNMLKKIMPHLEKRLRSSCFEKFSGTIMLDFFKTKLDLFWRQGICESVKPGSDEDCPNTFCINEDLFPALCLGHRTWRELQHVRPDIFPATQYIKPNTIPDQTGLLMDVLFPAKRSWIVEQY